METKPPEKMLTAQETREHVGRLNKSLDDYGALNVQILGHSQKTLAVAKDTHALNEKYRRLFDDLLAFAQNSQLDRQRIDKIATMAIRKINRKIRRSEKAVVDSQRVDALSDALEVALRGFTAIYKAMQTTKNTQEP